MQSPIKISRPKDFLLYAEWSDGFSATISLESLRKSCPCATCIGESIGEIIYSKPKPVTWEPGVFDLISLKPIGNYAIAASWGNGHNTGIYTWEKFREIFNKHCLNDEEIEEQSKLKKNDARKIKFNVI